MRRIILMTSLVLIAAPAAAQTTLGLRGGIGLATVAIDVEDVVAESRNGVVGGVDLTFPASNFVGFRVSGLYAQKGGEAMVDGADVAIEIEQVQASVLARIGTPSRGGFSVGVMAGPWAARQLSCNVEASAMGFDLNAECEDVEFDFDAIDYGIALGGGVEFPVGFLRLGVDALYSLGLATLDADDTRTRHLAVLGGIVIPFG